MINYPAGWKGDSMYRLYMWLCGWVQCSGCKCYMPKTERKYYSKCYECSKDEYLPLLERR